MLELAPLGRKKAAGFPLFGTARCPTLQGFFTLHQRVLQHALAILTLRKEGIMICLALGIGALGFYAMRRACRCYRGCDRGGCYGHDWHGHGHWHGHWQGYWQRRGLYHVLRHIDATPAQERAIVAEIDQLRGRMRAARAGMQDARADLAATVRAPELDDAALATLLGRVDGATGEVRAAAVEALRNIHALLDANQRERIADFIDASWWRRARPGNGPYRV